MTSTPLIDRLAVVRARTGCPVGDVLADPVARMSAAHSAAWAALTAVAPAPSGNSH